MLPWLTALPVPFYDMDAHPSLWNKTRKHERESGDMMGRMERQLSPGRLCDFAGDLRLLRANSGMTYRELAQRAGYSPSALSAAASGQALPTLDVLLAYVGACGAEPGGWQQRWEELSAAGRDRNQDAVANLGGEFPGGRVHDELAMAALPSQARRSAGTRPAEVARRPPPEFITRLSARHRPASGIPVPRAGFAIRSRWRWLALSILAIAVLVPAVALLFPGSRPPLPGTSFSGMAGPGCAPAPTASGTTASGTTASGTTASATAGPGWTWHPSGGYCGSFLSHYVTGAASGEPGSDPSDSTYTWSFQTRLQGGTCSVSVYIPVTDSKTAGGYAVRYTVSSGSGQQASFTLDQKDNRGRWLPGGTYSDDGTFTVVMDTAANGVHQVAASALKATCTA